MAAIKSLYIYVVDGRVLESLVASNRDVKDAIANILKNGIVNYESKESWVGNEQYTGYTPHQIIKVTTIKPKDYK